ncbi:hydrolase 1, exosortase A system-associated [Sphingomonas sp.]|uniref:hydrolase 1, exosortase A system-associated n=1 Tax=Sphingomonas sp. TaxID=28214 RepID=UPI001DDE59D5|nr:hydrolase 1, exosortase A system-associated [Sphingomonas sp.]MBX9796325.1 hydrolase 1, exosortase A system-associated [Sphingomonas sp.]
MRRVITFPCEGDTLFGTLDEAPGTTGLLIVSGGNEIRAGAHRGMAALAARVAAAGHPVFRFDRRGVGDSTGVNGGYASAAPDLAAAIATFRTHAPQVTRLVGFGNCDAATALLLHAPGTFDRLLLANPWVVEAGPLPPPAAIRAHYLARLTDPKAWARLLSGQIRFGKLFSGLRRISQKTPEELSQLEAAVFAALAAHPDARVLLASGDATAIAFADAARRAGHAGPVTRIDTASHSFADAAAKAALTDAVLAALG